MSGIQTGTMEHVIRAQIYTNQLKQVFEDKLIGTNFVYMLTGFPDGELINIPSIGNMEVFDYAEGNAVKYSAFDTGNFQFQINEYKQSGTFITDKFRQDSWMAPQIEAAIVPKMQRAIDVQVERSILHTGPLGQVSGNLNTINGVPHRWVTEGTNQVITLQDFAKARYALDRANVPNVGRTAIVDPSVEFAISTLAPVIGQSSQMPQWGSFLETGASNDMRFLRNIFGFDVWVSNHLLRTNETIDSIAAGAGVANLFFSAAGGDSNPIVGLVRQPPRVESKRDIDLQREDYVLTMRYGFGLYRPENMVVVITDTDQVFT